MKKIPVLWSDENYMCVNCGGDFPRDEMCFDTDYDCDFCQDCYDRAINKEEMNK